MKILYYSAHPHLNLCDAAGYGTHMREVIQAFRSQGHIVETLIIGGEKKKQPTTYKKSFIKELIRNLTPSIIWESLKDYQLLKIDKKSSVRLNNKVKTFIPDLIYERGYYLCNSGIDVSHSNNIKHYIELNAPYLEERVEFSGKSIFLNKAKKTEIKQLQQSSKIIVVTSALKDYFKKKLSTVEEKIIITPNAINFKNINTNKSNQLKLTTKYELNNQTVIGFVGSIFPYHGVDLLIQSFQKICKTHKDVKLLIIGDGETLDYLKNLAKSFNLEQSVIFTGKVEHNKVFDYIELMDITIMPKSNWYGSPVKIFEYGYMKKAVIAPDYQAIRDVLTHRKNSLLITPSISELTSSIEVLINDELLRNKIASQLKKDILEYHTWDKVAKKILS